MKQCPKCKKQTLERFSQITGIVSDGFDGEIEQIKYWFECPCGYGESSQ